MKIKKVKRAKSFRYNVNRKRVNKKIRGTGTIQDPQIRKAWNKRKTMTKNLSELGLSGDPNVALSIPTAKQKRLKIVKMASGFIEEDLTDEQTKSSKPISKVLEQMELDANEYRESEFRLPKGVVKFISYLLDTYGLNYKAMVKDAKNYDQLTWKQFRAKCRRFMTIPEQFNVYLESRKLDKDSLDWTEYDSDGEI